MIYQWLNLEPQDELTSVYIRYRSEAGNCTERTIVPIQVYTHYRKRYLRAFCKTRNAERTFRLDRIQVLSTFPDNRITYSPPPVLSVTPPVTPGAVITYPTYQTPLEPAKTYRPFHDTEDYSPSGPKRAPGNRVTFKDIAGICLFIVLACMFLDGMMKGNMSNPSGNASAPLASGKTETKPVHYERPIRTQTVYHGYRLWINDYGDYKNATVPYFGTDTMKVSRARGLINAAWFYERYGWGNEELFALFESADSNGSGALAWSELASFQKNLRRKFSYLSNDTALRPDQFMEQGGGDCEDWALMAANVCRYWGWEAYIGCWEGDESAHSVCLVRDSDPLPGGFTYYDLPGFPDRSGNPFPPGRYIPVDFDHVGSLSNAIQKGWNLTLLWHPEGIYGMKL